MKMLNNVIQLVHTILMKLLQKVFALLIVVVLKIRRFQILLMVEHNVLISVAKNSLTITNVLIYVLLLIIIFMLKMIIDVYNGNWMHVKLQVTVKE